MIFEVVLLGEDRLPIFWRRPVRGSSGFDPSFLTELLGKIESEARLTMGDEIRSGYEIGKYLLLVHHDGDESGVSIVRNVVLDHIDDPKKALEALRQELLPLVDELELLLEIMPKEEFEIRSKRPSVFKKIAKVLSRKSVTDAILAGKLEEAIYAKPKDDVERALRIMAATHMHFMPPKYPAPSEKDIAKVLNEISDPLLKEISKALLERVSTGLSIELMKVVQQRFEELNRRIEQDKRVALLLVGPPMSDPRVHHIADLLKDFSSYRHALAETYKTIFELLSSYSTEAAISILGTFKAEHPSPEEEFLEASKVASALEVLVYTPYDDPDKLVNRLSEESLRALDMALEALEEDPRLFCSLLLSVPLSLSYVIAILGLYHYHSGSDTYRAYFLKLKRALEVISKKTFEYLKYARISGLAAMIALANVLPLSKLVEEIIGEKPKGVEVIPRRLARYVSEGIGETLQEVYNSDKQSYATIATAFIEAVSAALEEISPEYLDIAARVSKNAMERIIISSYSDDKAVCTMLGFTIPRIRTRTGVGESVVREVLNVLREKLSRSLARLVVSAEAARVLEQGGFRSLAERACEYVEKSIICERLKG